SAGGWYGGAAAPLYSRRRCAPPTRPKKDIKLTQANLLLARPPHPGGGAAHPLPPGTAGRHLAAPLPARPHVAARTGPQTDRLRALAEVRAGRELLLVLRGVVDLGRDVREVADLDHRAALDHAADVAAEAVGGELVDRRERHRRAVDLLAVRVLVLVRRGVHVDAIER